jgi:hypothetical protein
MKEIVTSTLFHRDYSVLLSGLVEFTLRMCGVRRVGERYP